jgi:E3 ubiquitin-protein ligase RNF115/126
MSKAWCYQCEKSIEATAEGLCPICKADFIEYGNGDFNAEEPISRPAQPTPQPQRQNGPRITIRSTRVTPNGIFQNVYNDILGAGINQQEVNRLQNMFQGIVNGVLGPLLGIPAGQRNGGEQQGDYFFGNEDQLQALAERLFRLNSGSLGSPPTAESFKEKLKPEKYTDGSCVEDTCSVCLEQFQKNDDIVVLPCKHGFHPQCIDPWLNMHSECPSCRHKLPAQE